MKKINLLDQMKISIVSMLVISSSCFASISNEQAQDLLRDIKGSYSGVESKKECFNQQNLNELTTHIKQSNANTYIYSIPSWDVNPYCSSTQIKAGEGLMNRLPQLLSELRANNVNVWVSFGGAGTRDYPAFHYESLIDEVIAIKTGANYSNLTAISIDDFDIYLDVNNERYTFSTQELTNIQSKLHNSDMAFIPTAYYRDDLLTNDAKFNNYKKFFDGILFPYLFSANGTGLQTYQTSMLDDQLKEIKTKLGSVPLIVDIYATSYTNDSPSSFNQHHSEDEYVKEVAEAAHRYADGIMIYRTLNDTSNNILYGSPLDPNNSAYGCPAVYFQNNEHISKKEMMSQLFQGWENEASPTGSRAFLELTEQTYALRYTGSPKVSTSELSNRGACKWTGLWPAETRKWEKKYYTEYLYSSSWFVPDKTQPNFANSKFLLSGHFDINNTIGNEEIVNFSLLSESGQADIYVYKASAGENHNISQVPGYTGDSWYSRSASNFRFDAINHAVSGDFNGDNVDEIVTFYDYDYNQTGDSSYTQSLFTFSMSGNQFYTSNDYSATKYSFNFDSVKFAVAGDFDGDDKDELLSFYQYNNAAKTEKVFAFEKEGSNSFSQWKVWNDFTGSHFQFDNIRHVVVDDFDQNNYGDELAVVYNTGSASQIRMFRYENGALQEYNTPWYSAPIDKVNFDIVKQVVAGDFDGDGYAEIALYYRYNTDKYKLFLLDNKGEQSLKLRSGSSDFGYNRQFNRRMPDFVISGNFYNESGDDKKIPSNMRDEIISLHR